MKKWFVLLMVLCCRGLVAQPDSSFRFFKGIKGDIVSFSVDNLDNIYLLSSTNQVKKLNANGDSMAVFNDVRKYGKASLIDVSNPLKVLLYYQDFATIVVPDRLLNVRNSIDLRKQNILQVGAIGQSYDNKIWVYDEVENKLKKIDEEGKMLLETPDFRQLFEVAPAPQKIYDQDQYVYLYDSTQGVFVFDYYGALKNRIPISRWSNFKVTGRLIFGSAGRSLFRYNIQSFRMDEWNMPETLLSSLAFGFTATRLYALKNGVLEIYSYR
jgi:hypothetical protein